MKEKFLSIDTETTSADVHSAHVVTLGMAAGTRDEVLFKDEILFQVEEDIPAEATAVHGITTEKANSEGLPRGAMSEFAELLDNSCSTGEFTLVAYNASFDLTILRNEFDRLGISQPRWEKIKIIDPFVLDKHVDKYRKGSRALSSVFSHYTGEELKGAHGAIEDAIASLRVLFGVLQHFGDTPLSNGKTLLESVGSLSLNEVQKSLYEGQSRSLEAYFKKVGREITSPFNHEWPIKERALV